jgi:glycerate-2-kinase
LEALYRAALAGVDPRRGVAAALERPAVARALASARRLGVFAVGKAAAGMLEAAPQGNAGMGILPQSYPRPPRGEAEVLFASHPSPSRSSVAAARRAVAFFGSFGEKDAILCLISGGASSLLCLPRPGITLARKRAAIEKLMASGASIVEINRLRKRLSAVKGGKLGRATRARLVTLVLSDVPGDDPALVGSGPTVRGRSGDITLVVGSNARGLEAAGKKCLEIGFEPIRRRRWLSGDAREQGARFARAALRLEPGSGLLGGGETAVTLSRHPGRGGRSLEFALGAALELDGSEGIALLAAGSDGIDGASRAAGAFADGTTIKRAGKAGLDPRAALARHDTEAFFDALGDLLVTGPTGTNVCDWAFALRQRDI